MCIDIAFKHFGLKHNFNTFLEKIIYYIGLNISKMFSIDR